MKANAGVVITGQQVTLVPYETQHVAKYHNWMKDPWLQEMTASEPLSIEEELEMQKSWREDAEKCTFIVLEKSEGDGKPGASYVDESAVDRMAGDVNLFFNDYDDPKACEMEIMIAEEKYRRKGFAEEAVKLMMAYATSKLHVTRFVCKIIETNGASLQLFEKLGYEKYNYVAAFKQVEMELVTKDKHTELVDAVLKSAAIHAPQ
ncbi:hypothetical protein KRP22_005784 [Phytophthora ramorum]|nr:N-acetyltransferase 9-like protein [Phytophthora ramorum]